MRLFTPLLLLALATPLAAQTPTGPMALADTAARQAIDHDAVITGPVAQVKARTHDGTAYLNFGGRFPAHTFSVIIPDSAVARFGDLSRFEGHRARATGHVW